MAAEDWIDDSDWDGSWGPDEPWRRQRAPLKRKQSTPGCWTTAKGEVVPFRDMEDRHLLNTIAFVERDYRGLQDTFCDAALDIDLIWPQHAGLVAEARRRNLVPKGKKGLVTS